MIKSYVPRFLYVPHSPQNLRPGNTAANIPNLMKHIISTALAVLAFFMPPANAAAQKRIVINSEPAGAEVYVNGIPTNQQTPAMLKNPGGKAFSVGFGKKGYEDGKLLVVKQKKIDGKKA
ncbi:PEGA domain-containing protein [uncultured Alistipes sp.]|uniref:PEGA domain-containing protein n=1 Tax=uncultured Alistipes sp. TaxID=538949 RepID=UPI002609C1E8|nr:PEGA domain-containing protein [uncultured Alistipes sp.]